MTAREILEATEDRLRVITEGMQTALRKVEKWKRACERSGKALSPRSFQVNSVLKEAFQEQTLDQCVAEILSSDLD